VAISSDAGALRTSGPGNNLLRGADPARLTVGADGRIQNYVPFATLAPRQVYVIDVTSPCP
jgi:hypothetical protein